MSENIITTSVDMKDNAPTPTPEPLVDGNIEDLMENIEEGDIVWSILELQKVVNGFNDDLGLTFSEYITEAKTNVSDDKNYEKVHEMLENLEDAVELNSMTLFYTLRNSFPEISFLDIPEGFNYVSEFFPENLKQKLIETGNRSVQGRETVYIDENTNRARAVLSSEFNFNDKGYVPGGMIIDGVNYKQGFPDFINTIYIVGKLEKEGVFYPIGVRVDENQKLYLTLLSNEEIDNFL